jgi:hypothetical protein
MKNLFIFLVVILIGFSGSKFLHAKDNNPEICSGQYLKQVFNQNKINAARIEFTEQGIVFIIRAGREAAGILLFYSQKGLVTFSHSRTADQKTIKSITDNIINSLKSLGLSQCGHAYIDRYDEKEAKDFIRKSLDNYLLFDSLRSPEEKQHAIDTILIVIVYFLLLLLLPFLYYIFREFIRISSEWSAKEKIAIFMLLSAGLIIRILAPHRMVMVFMGYNIVESAISLENLPRYGASALVLYHLFMKIFPADHVSVLWLNSIIGTFNIVLTVFILRCFLKAFSSGIFLAGMLSLTPVFIRDHNSESILVPAMFFLLTSVFLLQNHLKYRKNSYLAGSLTSLVLASLARPELMLLAPLTWVFFLTEKPVLKGSIRILFLISMPFFLIYMLNALRLFFVMQREMAFVNFPDMEFYSMLSSFVSLLSDRNLVFNPDVFPVMTVILAFTALIISPERTRVLRLIILSVLFSGIYFMDFNEESMLRLHIPEAVFITMAASTGLSGIAGKLKKANISLILILSVLWIVSAAFTANKTFMSSNSDEEDVFFREAVSRLPDEPVLFVRLGYGDIPEFYDGLDIYSSSHGHTGRVHRFYPDYLINARGRNDRILNIRIFEIENRWDMPVYFYLGMRCYAYHSLPMHPQCEKMLKQYRAVPVITKQVINHGEFSRTFQWYPSADHFELGLYGIYR